MADRRANSVGTGSGEPAFRAADKRPHPALVAAIVEPEGFIKDKLVAAHRSQQVDGEPAFQTAGAVLEDAIRKCGAFKEIQQVETDG